VCVSSALMLRAAGPASTTSTIPIATDGSKHGGQGLKYNRCAEPDWGQSPISRAPLGTHKARGIGLERKLPWSLPWLIISVVLLLIYAFLNNAYGQDAYGDLRHEGVLASP